MKISVVTVCLNCRKYIGTALECVKKQNYSNIEHVVIDGGSSDGTIEVVKSFADSSDAFRWYSRHDAGIADAMNRGLELATGDIVGFLHADDFYPDPGALHHVAEAFAREPWRDWATGGAYFVDAAGVRIREIGVRRYSFRRLIRYNIMLHPSTFVRRPALLAVGGFDTSLRYAMDYDLWLRLGERSTPLLINRPLACFRLHLNSCSSVNADAAFDEEYRIRTAYLHRTGTELWPHKLRYMLMRPLNRLFYGRFLAASGGG